MSLITNVYLMVNIKQYCQTVIGEVNLERVLNWGKEHQAETLVVLTHRLEQSTIAAATAALQRHNEANNAQTRFVM